MARGTHQPSVKPIVDLVERDILPFTTSPQALGLDVKELRDHFSDWVEELDEIAGDVDALQETRDTFRKLSRMNNGDLSKTLGDQQGVPITKARKPFWKQMRQTLTDALSRLKRETKPHVAEMLVADPRTVVDHVTQRPEMQLAVRPKKKPSRIPPPEVSTQIRRRVVDEHLNLAKARPEHIQQAAQLVLDRLPDQERETVLAHPEEMDDAMVDAIAETYWITVQQAFFDQVRHSVAAQIAVLEKEQGDMDYFSKQIAAMLVKFKKFREQIEDLISDLIDREVVAKTIAVRGRSGNENADIADLTDELKHVRRDITQVLQDGELTGSLEIHGQMIGAQRFRIQGQREHPEAYELRAHIWDAYHQAYLARTVASLDPAGFNGLRDELRGLIAEEDMILQDVKTYLRGRPVALPDTEPADMLAESATAVWDDSFLRNYVFSARPGNLTAHLIAHQQMLVEIQQAFEQYRNSLDQRRVGLVRLLNDLNNPAKIGQFMEGVDVSGDDEKSIQQLIAYWVETGGYKTLIRTDQIGFRLANRYRV